MYRLTRSLAAVLTSVLLWTTTGTAAADGPSTMDLVRNWVQGSYDNTAQAEADAAGDVPDPLRHRVMYQVFVPVTIPGIPGHTVFQQSSVDGSNEPDRITRLGLLQFSVDEETGLVRQRELNFRDPEKFYNAHRNPELLNELTLDAFEWDAGCDFHLAAADDGSRVSGRIPAGTCRVFNPGTGTEMIADDEVVITPDQYWFMGRFVDADGRVMWGNASDEHVKMNRVAGVEELVSPPGDNGVLIFGATRNTGLETARLLIERGDTVTAFVRPTSDRTALEALGGVRFVVGDAIKAGEVQAAFDGARYSAVVTTLGCFRCETPPDYIGNRHVFDAAKAAGVDRVVMVSSLGAGNTADAIPWIVRWVLSDVNELKTLAENHLMASGLDYTIIRPGGLKSEPATGRGVLTTDPDAMGIINRADLAQLVVDVLDDPATRNTAFAAIDPEYSWPWDMFF